VKWARDPRPRLGATREVVRFAWLPTPCGELTVWLEHYVVRERWAIRHLPGGGWVEGWAVEHAEVLEK
jgi:hypothetical protein